MKTNHRLLSIFIIFGLLSLTSACTVFGIRNSEQAKYTVLLQEDNIEIRQYAPSLVAKTTTTGDYKASGNTGFRRLAKYIFGENQTQESIEMTTPVVRENSSKIAMTIPVLQKPDEDSWTMSFVLPAEYTLETIPMPIDKNITIEQIEEKKIAAIQYSGFINQNKIDEHAEILKQWLSENGYVALSDHMSAAYDPPWTIPWMKRNEVLIEIE